VPFGVAMGGGPSALAGTTTLGPKEGTPQVPLWMKGTPSFAPSATVPPTNGIHAVRGGGAALRCGSPPELRAAEQRLFPVVPMVLVTKQRRHARTPLWRTWGEVRGAIGHAPEARRGDHMFAVS
jgi:hypothetical protein